MLERLQKESFSLGTLIHPSVLMGQEVTIGTGTVIMAGAVINPSTTIGKGCIINTSSIVEHDNRISDYVHISPGVQTGGNVEVGKSSWLGIGSTVINNVSIISECIVGAGSVVVSSLTKKGVYYGKPANLQKDKKRR